MVCSRYPRECLYYEAVLKRKSLRKLRYNVWENKTKWKLVRVAAAHHDAKLLHGSFHAWILFLKESLRKRINARAANAHYEDKLRRKGIVGLRRNAELWRMVAGVWKKKTEWNAKLAAWNLWRHYTQKRLKLRQIDALASKVREQKLLVRFFYLWSFRYKEKVSLEAAFEKASTEHSRKLKQQAFAWWKIFKDKEICKKQIQRLATACYEDILTEKIFWNWKKYVIQKSQYRNRIQAIENFHERNLVENYLNRWLGACRAVIAQREARNLALAFGHHARKLLEKGFEGFIRMKERTRIKEEKAKKFTEIHAEAHVSFYLELWERRRAEKLAWNHLEAMATEWRELYLTELLLTELSVKYKERTEEREEIRKVIKYSNAITIHTAFKAWKEATARRLGKKLKEQAAVEYYFEKLSRRALESWETFVVLRSNKAAARNYYRNRLLAKAINYWRSFLKEGKTRMAGVKHLERKYELNLLRESFEAWKNAAVESQSLTILAAAFYDKSKLTKVFAAWKRHARTKSANKFHYNSHKDTLNEVRIKNVLSRWREMLTAKQNLWKKVEEVSEKRNRRALSLRFTLWRKLVEKMKNLRQTVEFFPQLQSTVLLENYFDVMCRGLRDKRAFKKKEELARRTEDKLLKKRYLRRWLGFLCWKKEKLRLLSGKEKSYEEPRRAVRVSLPPGRGSRRKPIIPDYLREEIPFEQFSEASFHVNEETFAIEEPVNRKLPVVGQKGTFVSFEV